MSLYYRKAPKDTSEKGISLNGSTTKDASVYETVQETAESVRDSVIAFTGSDAESLYDSRKLGQYGKDCNRSEVICGKL